MTRRCYLVYALAPEGVSAREANDLLNEYVGDHTRGMAVYHDHFIGRHGGVAVFDVATEEESSRLTDPGPLTGWELEAFPLTFSGSAVGFAAQVEFTLRAYRDTTLAELDSAEEPSKRQWWRKERHSS